MSNASTKRAERAPDPAEDDDDVDLSSPRFKRITRPLKGKNPHGSRFTLAGCRVGLHKTQAEVAAASGLEQSVISRLERRHDALVSTLRKYAEALGAECEVTFVWPTGHRMVIVDPETAPATEDKALAKTRGRRKR